MANSIGLACLGTTQPRISVRPDVARRWSSDYGITYRHQGTDAVAKGVIVWPYGEGSVLHYQRKEGERQALEFTRQWFPDAIASTMGALISSLETNTVPLNSARDNLRTMRAGLSAYQFAVSVNPS